MFVNFHVEDVYTINNHACISFVQKLHHAMAHEINFHFLSYGDGYCMRGGINEYKAALELDNRVKGYMMENNEEVEKQQLDG